MKRRFFLKWMSLLNFSCLFKFDLSLMPNLKEIKRMNWVWFNLSAKKSLLEWEEQFIFWREHEITGLLPNIYNSKNVFFQSEYLKTQVPILEDLLPLAKKYGFQVHGWMWTMPNNDADFAQQHPEAFVVNRLGESAATRPAYVNHYKFLCPNQPQTKIHIKNLVTEIAQIELLDGVHLDYIRYPDVILPIGIQPKYEIVQDKEYPQFDYCYCETCRTLFKSRHGIDPLEIEDPANHDAWNQFRYDSITHIVNEIVLPVARKAGKKVSAAVFPNWQDVRQQWQKWNIDFFFPMLYHKFYHEDSDWISKKIVEEKSFLKPEQKIFAGLFGKFFDSEELQKTLKSVIFHGADGVSLFTGFSFSNELWEDFSETVQNIKSN